MLLFEFINLSNIGKFRKFNCKLKNCYSEICISQLCVLNLQLKNSSL